MRLFVETQDLLELSSIHAFVVLVLVLIQETELFVNRFQWEKWKNLFKTELSEDARQQKHPAAVEIAPAVVVFFEKDVAVAIALWTFYVRIGGRFSRGILISNSHMQWFLQGKVFKKCAFFFMLFLLWCYVDSGMWKNLGHSTIHCILQDKIRLMIFVLLEKFVWIVQLQCVFEMHRKSNMSSTRRNMVIHST